MKKIIYSISILIIGAIITPFITYSQNKGKTIEQQKSIEDVDLKKDFDVVAKGLIKKSKQASIAKLSLHFKTITNGKATVGKGQNRSYSTAWAILEGVSEEAMQEIADQFYTDLNGKLEKAGLPMLGWDKVQSAKSFPKVQDKQIDKYWDNKNEGAITVKTANNGPHVRQVVGNIGIWKSLASLGKDIGANPLTIDIIIDFARFDIDMSRRRGYYNITTKASSNTYPEISIQAMSGAQAFNTMNSNFTMIGKYGEAGIITLKKNVNFEYEFATELDSYNGKLPTSMKKGISFTSNLTTGTSVIKVNEEKYKEAVLGALNRYADLIILKLKEVRG